MAYQVLITHPTEPSRTARCEASIVLGAGHPKVPLNVYKSLELPGWALLEFEGQTTHMSVEPSGDDSVQITLAMLTALGLEMDRSTGALRSVELMLHYPVVLLDNKSS